MVSVGTLSINFAAYAEKLKFFCQESERYTINKWNGKRDREDEKTREYVVIYDLNSDTLSMGISKLEMKSSDCKKSEIDISCNIREEDVTANGFKRGVAIYKMRLSRVDLSFKYEQINKYRDNEPPIMWDTYHTYAFAQCKKLAQAF